MWRTRDSWFVLRARREVVGALPYPPVGFGSMAVSGDGRALDDGAQLVGAKTWLMTRPASR